jgi:hypothetical protein
VQKTRKIEEENKKKAGWFGGWWGGGAADPNSSGSDIGNLFIITKFNLLTDKIHFSPQN